MSLGANTPDGARLLLLTCAHNEARFAKRLVTGVVTQTRPPDEWVIVDDGSDDATYETLSELVSELNWVTLVRVDERSGRIPDGRAAGRPSRALNHGLASAALTFTHLGKLDADVELPSGYLERLLADFGADSQLGMMGGALTECRAGKWRRVRQPVTHPPAPARLYTRECFEASGGFRERLAWDTIDEIYARMRGYRTWTDRTLTVRHLRSLGTADGRLRGRARHGECAWILHYPAPWVLLRSVKVAATFSPFGVAGLAFLYGYSSAALRSVPQVDDAEFRRFVRHDLRGRALSALRRPLVPAR
jgi:glycosyltransferase involved in cell wall biosynthesis